MQTRYKNNENLKVRAFEKKQEKNSHCRRMLCYIPSKKCIVFNVAHCKCNKNSFIAFSSSHIFYYIFKNRKNLLNMFCICDPDTDITLHYISRSIESSLMEIDIHIFLVHIILSRILTKERGMNGIFNYKSLFYYTLYDFLKSMQFSAQCFQYTFT